MGTLPAGFEYVGGKLVVVGDPKMGTVYPFLFQARVDGGRPYYAAASFSNTSGIPLDFRTVPLDIDALFLLTHGGWPPLFNNFTGNLDSSGQAVGVLNIPVIPALNGIPLMIAFITLDPGAPTGVRTVSKATKVTLRL